MPADESFLRHFPNFDRHGPIWRYMDRPKFESLLKTSALWFSSADKFDDTFEGSISDATRKVLTYGPDVTPEMISNFSRIHLWWRNWTNISCWQYAAHENSLMWQAYAKTGVAIRSTFAKLSAELPSNAILSPVMYKDFSKYIVAEGTYTRYLTKRHFFAPEREVRAVIVNAPANESGTEDLSQSNASMGLLLPINLSSMIEAVVARPYASAEEFNQLQQELDRFGHKVELRYSSLSGEPRWN